MREEQKMDLGDDKVSRDLIAVARDGKLGAVIILEIRDGYVIGRKQFEVACPLEEDEGRMVADFLKGYYLRRGAEAIPREIVLSHAPDAEEHWKRRCGPCAARPWTWRCPRRARSAGRSTWPWRTPSWR